MAEASEDWIVWKRPVEQLLAEMKDVADWIERTKPQGLLYSSAMPCLREAGEVITSLLEQKDHTHEP